MDRGQPHGAVRPTADRPDRPTDPTDPNDPTDRRPPVPTDPTDLPDRPDRSPHEGRPTLLRARSSLVPRSLLARCALRAPRRGAQRKPRRGAQGRSPAHPLGVHGPRGQGKKIARPVSRRWRACWAGWRDMTTSTILRYLRGGRCSLVIICLLLPQSLF